MPSVRAATLDDIPKLMAIERLAASAAHWPEADYQRLFSEGPPQRHALLIEDAGAICGFLVARELDDEWEIENIAVLPEARRRGLGSALVQRLLDLALLRGGHSIFLEVRESNAAARALYEKWAFRQSGRRTAYYRDPEEDAVVYRISVTTVTGSAALERR